MLLCSLAAVLHAQPVCKLAKQPQQFMGSWLALRFPATTQVTKLHVLNHS